MEIHRVLKIKYIYHMKLFFYILISICLYSCSENNGMNEESSPKDFSNDEIVLEELNRISGSKMTKDDICIQRPSRFKDLVLVGFFAHDRGCDEGMIFYKGKEVDRNTGFPEILNDNGWKEESKREEIAMEWVKNVSLAWVNVMEKTDEDFELQEEHYFRSPTVITKGDEVIVGIWVREPSGMNHEANFYFYTVAFSIPEADIVRTEITKRFTIDLE